MSNFTSFITKLVDIPFISQNTIQKLNNIPLNYLNPTPLNINLKNLLKKIIDAHSKTTYYKEIKSNITYVKNVFLNFSKDMNNIKKSKFTDDITKMSYVHTFKLKIIDDVIIINFISNKNNNNKNLIFSILHAINTFCLTFPSDYNNLHIYISLDDNKRLLHYPDNLNTIKEKLNYLNEHSLAFNVSGMTNYHDKIIILTKVEEIIKLLFHELVHYTKLDNFGSHTINFNFSITNNIIIQEAYAEFMSIILSTAYESIYISNYLNYKIYDVYNILIHFEKIYSIYLSTNLLKFYNYDKHNFMNFFENKEKKMFSYIHIWEYIIIRTQLLLNLNKVANLMGKYNWYVNEYNVNNLLDLMIINKNFLNDISFFMENTIMNKSLSYKIIDIDWKKINYFI